MQFEPEQLVLIIIRYNNLCIWFAHEKFGVRNKAVPKAGRTAEPFQIQIAVLN